MLLTCLHSRNDWRRLCFRYDLYIHKSCTVQSLLVTSLILSARDLQQPRKRTWRQSKRKTRTHNAADLLARQTMFVHWRHAARDTKTTPNKKEAAKKRGIPARRRQLVRAAANLTPWQALCDHQARLQCQTKEKEREREWAKEAERSLIYGSEPTHTHTLTQRCSPTAIGVMLWQQREGTREKEAAKRDVNGGILMVFNGP